MRQERKELRDIDDKDITAKFIGISLMKKRQMQQSRKEAAVKRRSKNRRKGLRVALLFTVIYNEAEYIRWKQNAFYWQAL